MSETNKDSKIKNPESIEYAKELADSQSFYEETIPYLEKVECYERLRASIAEQRLKRMVIDKQTIDFVVQAESMKTQTQNSKNNG